MPLAISTGAGGIFFYCLHFFMCVLLAFSEVIRHFTIRIVNYLIIMIINYIAK